MSLTTTAGTAESLGTTDTSDTTGTTGTTSTTGMTGMTGMTDTIDTTAESSTTASESCNRNDKCEPGLGENNKNCDDCRCGDGITFDPETCDNGDSNQSYWPTTPPDNACSKSCDTIDLQWCGDELLNGEEACDDGNNVDGDGCSADCQHVERRVFVSSATYKGDLNKDQNDPQELTGLSLADARCQALATTADLKGTYKAWLSDSSGSPFPRFDTKFVGHYRLVSKGYPIVATGWQGLTTEKLQHAINADEKGAPVSGKLVWTNTLQNGTTASNINHCIKWSSKAALLPSTVGTTDAADAKWTSLNAEQSCSGANRLYCFEDPT